MTRGKLYIIFALGNLADLLLTAYILTHYTSHHEGNPIIAFLIASFGLWGLLAWKTGLLAYIGVVTLTTKKRALAVKMLAIGSALVWSVSFLNLMVVMGLR